MQQFEQSEPFMGMHFVSTEMRKLTRRVLGLSCCAALLTVIAGVYNMVSGSVSILFGIIAVLIGLAVPACGYFGAKNNSSNAMCCFCFCNFLGGCWQVAQVVMLYVLIQVLDYMLDNCNPSGYQLDGCPGPDQWRQICDQIGLDGANINECYAKMQDSADNLKTAVLALSIIMCIPGVLLQCCSFWFGKKLYDELQAQRQVVVASPPNVPVNMAQPQPGIVLS